MTKQELIAFVASNASLTKVQAANALDSVIQAITESLTKGESVNIAHLGTFHVTQRKGRTGRNPRTGEPLVIAAYKQPGLRFSSRIKDHLN